MATIKILIRGYAKRVKSGWKASATTCLITANNKKIITDPGCHRKKLLEALAKEKLTTDDIDYVFLSHCHPDHILLAGIFAKAKFITFDSNFLYTQNVLSKFTDHLLGPDIKIIETPGHTKEHLSLLVATPQGKIAIAGDVFWWPDGKKQIGKINQKDYSGSPDMNMKKLITSRKKLLTWADYIIPGHGKMFAVKNK